VKEGHKNAPPHYRHDAQQRHRHCVSWLVKWTSAQALGAEHLARKQIKQKSGIVARAWRRAWQGSGHQAARHRRGDAQRLALHGKSVGRRRRGQAGVR